MRVKDVMHTDYVTIEKDARIKDALAKMAKYNTNRLLVTRKKGDKTPYGIITEYDIFYRLSRSKMKRFEPYNTSVASAATTPVDTATAEMEVSYITKNMLMKGYSSMPVTDDNNIIVGVVSKRDILKLFYKDEELLKIGVMEVTNRIRGKIRLFDKLTLALSKFMGTGFSNLVVMDEGRPVGLLRAYDVAKVLFTIRKINPTPHWENAVKEVYVADVMRRDIRILTPENTLKDALDIILNLHQNIIPVAENDKAIGIVSRSNLLKFMLEKKII